MTQPGDVLLWHGTSPFSRFIEFGQSVPWTDADSRYAWFSHVSIIEVADPVHGLHTILEAGAKGICRRTMTEKDFNPGPTEAYISASDADRAAALRWAAQQLGAPYDWYAIAGIALEIATGTNLCLHQNGAYICSAFAAEYLRQARLKLPCDPICAKPADLARWLGVFPPRKGAR